MKEFPKYVEFKGKWRKYQKKVIQELEVHLEDRHLHVIAPPGSGKTILGLEIARRLNKPTIIFTPTIAIRNQWVERFTKHFMDGTNEVDWISKDIQTPKFLTIITYQSVHSALSDVTNENLETLSEPIISDNQRQSELIKLFKKISFQTFIFDEAHHIKNEWWKPLNKLKKEFTPYVVGLTATPPYDTTAAEWQRYIQLNGPIDIEISVPELILENDLCPHQDYLYFTMPDESEVKQLLTFSAKVNLFYEELKKDETILEAIESHPMISEPELHLDWIYNNLDFYLASLIFINNFNNGIDEKHFYILGNFQKIPTLNLEWMEKLMNYYIFDFRDQFVFYEKHIDIILQSLKRTGLINKNRINFNKKENQEKQITFSLSKIKAIHSIVNFEYENLEKLSRIVVLTDFIKKEFLSNYDENSYKLTKIGAIPIFESLRRNNKNNMKIAVLTGSIVLIPLSAKTNLMLLAEKGGLANINLSTLKYDKNYLQITLNGHINNQIIHWITHLFEIGEIEVLIGTKSLLGEGWDAPFINTLVLASFVGSFVTSNQMRGRAIRTCPNNNNKTSNIWHLICLDPTSNNGGNDVAMSKRKFKNFVGISNTDDVYIGNGINRLGIEDIINSKFDIGTVNETTFNRAKDRANLSETWSKGITLGTKIIEELKIKCNFTKPYSLIVQEQKVKLKNKIISTSTLVGVEASLLTFSTTFFMVDWIPLFYILNTISIIGIGVFGFQTFKYFKSYIKHRDISKDIIKIANALISTLIYGNYISKNRNDLVLNIEQDENGNTYCSLRSPHQRDIDIFIKSMQEIVNPINNPKFVIIRKSKLDNLFDQYDYHSVPEILTNKKGIVDYFHDQWVRHVGSAQIINTRSIEGRQFMLKARAWSILHTQVDKSEHNVVWR